MGREEWDYGKIAFRDLDNSGSTGPAGRHVGEGPEVVILSNTNMEQRLTQVIILQEAYGFRKLGAKLRDKSF